MSDTVKEGERSGTVLVTGGTGFIGSHTVAELENAGYRTVILDDLSNSSEKVLTGLEKITGREIEFVQADCRDREALRNLFEKYRPDSVIHFAALKAVGESVYKPLEYYGNNLGALITVLEVMGEFEVNKFVFSSSATVYGQPDVLPATEHTPMQPAQSPYGATKQISEQILKDFALAYPTVQVIALRYFNPIGAHESAMIGELPIGKPNNLVPFITQTAAGIHPELSVFGNDYNTPDGTPVRDYIDINDLAAAHVSALEYLSTDFAAGNNYHVFNIGTGKPLSVLQLIEAFEKVNGVKVPYKIVGRRDGDVESVWADSSLSHSKLGWKPVRSIEQTLHSAWEWEKKLRGI